MASGKAGMERNPHVAAVRRKLAYFGHILRKTGRCLAKEVIQTHVADEGQHGSTTSRRGPLVQLLRYVKDKVFVGAYEPTNPRNEDR